MSRRTRYQDFSATSDPSLGPPRLARLRGELASRGVDGFLVPRADARQGEYVAPCDERLAWLTGFTGSAGVLAVLPGRAVLLVDGRYGLQARAQVDEGAFEVASSVETPLREFLSANLPPSTVLGYDPALHTSAEVAKLETAAGKAGAGLQPLDANPVDTVWADRPAPPSAPLRLHPEDLAGESRASKLARLRTAVAADGLAARLVTDPHAIAWVLNLRGGDVDHTPVALLDLLVPREGRATLYAPPGKAGREVRDALAPLLDLAPPEALDGALAALGAAGAKVGFDAATAGVRLARIVEGAGGKAETGEEPLARMKAVKSAAEIAGARAAHSRDGAALTRFLAWLAAQPPGSVTEIGAAERLEAFRAETGLLRDLSFPTIAGAGANGAIVHYRVTEATDARLSEGLFLVDSGAQYEDGTTDVTRTVAIGTPDATMIDRATRVLKGHVALARAVFPAGTTGAQLDALARLPLWEVGLDYGHGTGHGVGSYLSVHEGPQRLAKTGHAKLERGMILSNEPGYYAPGRWGIRLENLLLVEPREVPGAEHPMLGFETLTLAPFDRALIDPALLGPAATAWLDAYHARVRREIGPRVDGATRGWLEAATAPLAGAGGA